MTDRETTVISSTEQFPPRTQTEHPDRLFLDVKHGSSDFKRPVLSTVLWLLPLSLNLHDREAAPSRQLLGRQSEAT